MKTSNHTTDADGAVPTGTRTPENREPGRRRFLTRAGGAAAAAGVLALLLITPTAGAKDGPRDGQFHSVLDLLGELRTLDGTSNNLAHPDWGRAGIELLRLTTTGYSDGANAPGGINRPSPRLISNLVVAQPGSILNARGASDFIWQWGQFVDHDTDLVPTASPAEPFNIPVPAGDPFFDPFNTGTKVIGLNRSVYTVVSGVRQQVNVLTAYLDASQVYGSDAARSRELRALDGTGRLKTSAGDLLPFNVNGIPNGPSGTDPTHFLAGDVRANEQVGLTAMHTLFVREHNFWADEFHRTFRHWSDEDIFQMARAIVAAECQVITFNEWLPVLLGPNAISPYTGYQPHVNAGIDNVFAAAAFRVGHTLLSPTLARLDKKLRPIPLGHLPLRDSFFNPGAFVQSGVDPLLRGLATQRAQELDNMIVDDVRNFLFGPPGSGGFDLASLNIQRGREHGLPSYNQVRADYDLSRKAGFADVNPDPAVHTRLAAAYATVDDIDIWVGALSESHVPGAMLGDTLFTILKDQFERLRDGDRFWYQHYLPHSLQELVEEQTLAKIIRRNTSIRGEISDNAFVVPHRRDRD